MECYFMIPFKKLYVFIVNGPVNTYTTHGIRDALQHLYTLKKEMKRNETNILLDICYFNGLSSLL